MAGGDYCPRAPDKGGAPQAPPPRQTPRQIRGAVNRSETPKREQRRPQQVRGAPTRPEAPIPARGDPTTSEVPIPAKRHLH